mgnify:CR=1 FL=1
MNPFLWILWALAALVVLFVVAAVLIGLYEAIRDAVRKPCPHCGRRPGDKTYVPTAWTDDSA